MKSGEPMDIAAVMAQYEGKLTRYVNQLVWPDSASTQDVVQETFLRLHKTVNSGKPHTIDRVQSWLFRVAHNLAMDVQRKRARNQRLQSTVLEDPVLNPERMHDGEAVDTEYVHRESCREALCELRKLPEEQKQIILLKIMEGLTLREIGEITGLKIGTVNYRLTRGLAALAETLRRKGVTPA